MGEPDRMYLCPALSFFLSLMYLDPCHHSVFFQVPSKDGKY